MKNFKSIGLLIIAMAFVTGLSSCGKDFQGDIDDLNQKYTNIDERVTKLEEQTTVINNQLTQLSVLATAIENGFYVTQVKTVTEGYELTLNNGRIIILQYGPGNTLTPAPYISMVVINNINYWTVNGMLIVDANGRPIPANGQTPVVRYNTTINQWTVSIDGGLTFQNLNVFASITINDTLLLQVINNFISQHNTTIFSQEMLFQIISTYIQQNYSKVFNIELLNKVIVNYLDTHYTQIFDYDMLVQLFNQYNFEYAAQNIDVDIITNILINFIREHKEIFINNEVLFEIIRNYVEINKTEIFDIDIIAQVINNYIENNTNFINIDLLKQIINNYIDLHQEIIFDNDVFITILRQYVQENYLAIFSQDILYQVINNYITLNKTDIFNETLIRDIINNYVQNNYTTIIDVDILRQIINDYITVNPTTIIDEHVLYQVISSYFKTNYNIFIDETFIKQIINQYITDHQTTIIDIDIVRQVVNEYVSIHYTEIFDIDILNQIVINYFNNSVEFQQIINQYTGIIKNVEVNDEVCIVTLSDNRTIQLPVYDAYARVRDRVQSIVVVPDANGFIYRNYGMITYVVTPASMANIIQDKVSRGEMTAEFLMLDYKNEMNKINTYPSVSDYGILQFDAGGIYITNGSVALRIKDNAEGGTDYVTTFTKYGN